MSDPNYIDPDVAYNTGYNDGVRETEEKWFAELERVTMLALADRTMNEPRLVGFLLKTFRALRGEQ